MSRMDGGTTADAKARKRSIATKRGDGGTTRLGGGGEISKADARVEAYGAIDELNTVIGLARAACDDAEICREVRAIAERDSGNNESDDRSARRARRTLRGGTRHLTRLVDPGRVSRFGRVRRGARRLSPHGTRERALRVERRRRATARARISQSSERRALALRARDRSAERDRRTVTRRRASGSAVVARVVAYA